ncbi:Hypothetical predicted protein, partial [Marmota monax]
HQTKLWPQHKVTPAPSTSPNTRCRKTDGSHLGKPLSPSICGRSYQRGSVVDQ